MYQLWKVPVTALDDPPNCGEKIRDFGGTLKGAVSIVEQLCQRERDKESAYFVMAEGHCVYSVGLI